MIHRVRAFLLILAMLGYACAPAVAQNTQSALTALITNTLPDNATGAITPLIMRNVLNSMVLSSTCAGASQSLSWNTSALPSCASSLGILSNTRSPYTGVANMATTDCGKTVVLGGSAFYTFTLGAASGFDAACSVRIVNDDNSGNGNGKTLAINGYGNFILWPGQIIVVVNQSSAWKFNVAGLWSWTASHTFYVCHSNGVKTFASGGTSGSGMVASDNNDGLTINTPFATQQHAVEVLSSQIDHNAFPNTVQNCNETFTEAVNNNRTLTGYHIIYFQGDTATPSNVIHACGASAVCQNVRDFGISVISGFKYCSNTSCNTSTTGSTAMMSSQWGNIDYQQVEFGTFQNGNHIAVLQGGGINFTGTAYSITGGTNNGAHWYMQGPGHLAINGGSPTITVSGGLTFGNFLQMAGAGSNFSLDPSVVFAGAGAGAGTTAVKYNVGPRSLAQLNSVTLPGATGGSINCAAQRTVATSGTNATYSVPTCDGFLPLYIDFTLIAGGGGGAGSGTTPGAATAGTATCLKASGTACTSPLFQAAGGALGSTSTGTRSTGGAVSGCDDNIPGGDGGPASNQVNTAGGVGGMNTQGGSGQPGMATAGGAAATNTGAGGGGAGTSGTANTGGGGAAGGVCTVRISTTSVLSSYVYTVGASGTGGTAGGSGFAGGNGAVGKVIADAHWF